MTELHFSHQEQDEILLADEIFTNEKEAPNIPLTHEEMARFFPADELGIPLSIYIPNHFRDENGKLDKSNHRLDRHHRFAPKKYLIHEKGEIGKILRYSCLQIVPQELHANFNRNYKKPRLPESRPGKFGALLLSIARYLPSEAIDVTEGAPERRGITPEERQLIWANNELRPEQGSKIQREIINYVTKQNITEIDESLAKEFIYTTDTDRRITLGRKLFRMAAEVAVQPIEKAYIDAWDSGLLPRQDIRSESGRPAGITEARAVPKKPTLFIARHIVNHFALHRAVDRLYDNVSSQLAA